MTLSNAMQEMLALALHPLTGVLLVLLVVAAVIDWRTLRIPNWLTVGGIAYALVYSALFASVGDGGLLRALAGMGVGFAVLLPLYVVRIIGAGDVKLMAMVGAFLGASATLHALLFSLAIGGVAALGYAAWHGAVSRMARNTIAIVQSLAVAAMAGARPAGLLPGGASVGKMPYGVSISLGTLVSLAVRQLG